MKSLLDLLPILAPYILAPVAALIARHLKSPSDLQRAQLLSHLASDAAAWAVATYPGRTVPELVKIVVDKLTQMSGVPTTDAGAIERAAHGAVSEVTVPQT